MIRIVWADDEPDVLDLWRRLLPGTPQLQIVATCLTVPELQATLAALPAEVAVVDLGMFGASPIGAVADVVALYPFVRFVIYSGRADAADIGQLFDAGVMGYLDKLCTPDAMGAAIQRVTSGSRVFPPGFPS